MLTFRISDHREKRRACFLDIRHRRTFCCFGGINDPAPGFSSGQFCLCVISKDGSVDKSIPTSCIECVPTGSFFQRPIQQSYRLPWDDATMHKRRDISWSKRIAPFEMACLCLLVDFRCDECARALCQVDPTILTRLTLSYTEAQIAITFVANTWGICDVYYEFRIFPTVYF